MLLVNLHSPVERLDEVLAACSELGCFHPEPVASMLRGSKSMVALAEDNPYAARLQNISAIAAGAGIEPRYQAGTSGEPDETFLQAFETRVRELSEERRELTGKLEQQENALKHLVHIDDMNVSLDELFASKFVKVRFGRLPADSRPKLRYYENEIFFFHEFDFDGDYYWGFYLTTEEFEAVVDNIFASLFFERIFIPDYAHGTPRIAIADIQEGMDRERAQIAALDKQRAAYIETHRAEFDRAYSQLYYLSRTHEIRKYVAISNDGERQTFHMVGFVPRREQARFAARLGEYREVTVNFMPPEADERFTAPTRLRNNAAVRPFEMFVTMYGLPSQRDIDPTPFVAITYSLLFGAMFGDLGQGLAVSLLGLLLLKWKGMPLGGIMSRIGLVSAAFGLLYGSVFGSETALDPLYHALGMEGAPIHVMDGATINQILIAAVAAGAGILLISIVINIVQGLRQRDLARAVFDANGIAGLVLYAAVLIGLVCEMLLDIRVFVPLYLVLFVALPALTMFFREPILKLLRHARNLKPEDGVGGYIAENFFELFEVFLSFATNTMSFLRVGGFVLSHAGMMLVVYTLADMMQGSSLPVLVFGNLFVMALEGMIVGIQVLRLEFYEMFSRFYVGDGVPFEPVSF